MKRCVWLMKPEVYKKRLAFSDTCLNKFNGEFGIVMNWHLLPRTIVCPISVIPVFSRCWGVGNHIIREMPLSEMRGSVACTLKETRQEGRGRV